MQSWFLLLLILWVSCCYGLKCKTDEGLTEEDVKKIVRVCMRKIGNDYYDNEGSSSSNEDRDENYSDDSSDNSHRYNDRKNKNVDQENNYRYRNRDHLRGQGRMRREDMFFNQNSRYGMNNNNDWNRNQQQGIGYHNNSGRHSNVHDRRTDRDRACIVNCFFQELKMTNEEQFPDRHKVMHVVTKDLRDRQLKDFYSESIQECFHILELDHQRQEKCDFSRKLINCLAERARTNCDDWNNGTVLF